MAAFLPLVATLGACAAPSAPVGVLASAGPQRVTNGGAAFGMDEGALARKKAEAECSAQGRVLQTSIYDRFEAGTWVFVEGCA